VEAVPPTGVAVAVGVVGRIVPVGVAVAVPVGVRVAVPVAVAVAVAVAVPVAVAVGLCVAVAVGLSVAVGVTVPATKLQSLSSIAMPVAFQFSPASSPTTPVSGGMMSPHICPFALS
jgi:hypothetical protein